MVKKEHGGDIYTERDFPDGVELVDFSANLNPLGMPQAVKDALCQDPDAYQSYPDPQCRALRRAIGEEYGVPESWVVCGNGAADIIWRMVLSQKPKRAVLPAPTFSEYAEALETALSGTNYILNVHLKLDTGMTRIGFFAYDNDRTLDELKQAAALPHLHIEGVFMHFCVADSRAEEDVSFTKLQYKRFMDMLSAMEGVGIRPEIRHCCNSGAAILYPEFALDMVRPGIITYGNAPSEELEGAISLRPMMSLHSMIAQVRTVPAGTDISYGRLYRTTHDTRVAVLPIGYADGLSRLLTGKASFYLQGKLVPVIGRICMDMCMLDVSEVPDAKPGDIVTIFGYDDDGTLVPCERLAAAQGTINYELLCQISKRIPRICHRGAETSQILQYIV